MFTALSALMSRNFSKMFLRARRALEFSHSLDPKRCKPSDLFQIAFAQFASLIDIVAVHTEN
jgi:hypothetical protein